MLRLAGWLALAPLIASAQVNGNCSNNFEADFQQGGSLRLRIRSGDIDIVGVNDEKIRVSCGFQNGDREDEVRILFKPAGNEGELRIDGGPTNEFHARVEVPRRSHLYVRTPAGDLTVSGIAGNKDIELRAGELVIDVDNPAEYGQADASVTVGDLNAGAFGVNKGGLFRSFKQANPAGKYRIHAHVGAGDLTLR
jgi:hypothetical protein